jgi:hypothetical protein
MDAESNSTEHRQTGTTTIPLSVLLRGCFKSNYEILATINVVPYVPVQQVTKSKDCTGTNAGSPVFPY